MQKFLLQPDGKVIVNGNFPQGIARLNPDGSVDTTFQSAYTVLGNYPIALQPDGKVLLAAYQVTRLNSDGSLDSNFNPGTGISYSDGQGVNDMAIQSDGKIIVVGDFASFDGRSVNGIARLNADGTYDDTFQPGTGLAGNGYPRASQPHVAVQADGNIVVFGYFSAYNGVARNGIVRIKANGTLDPTFNPGTGFGGQINYYESGSIRIQSDGKIIVGSYFTSYNGTSCGSIVRLKPDGTMDTSFSAGTGFDLIVNDIIVQANGKIVVGGDFTAYNGVARRCITRINSDGSLDTTFNPGTGADNQQVYSVAVQTDGKVIVGGDFTSFNGLSDNSLIRLNVDGSLDATFQVDQAPGPNGTVTDTVSQADGKVIIVGSFTTVSGVSRRGVARLNADGTLDNNFNPGTGIGFGFGVNTVLLQTDGKVIVGGDFSNFNGTACGGIIRLNTNGSVDNTFNAGSGAQYSVNALAIQPADNKILVGGDFATFNGTTRHALARLLTNGALDTSFDPGLGANNTGSDGIPGDSPYVFSPINALLVLPSGSVIVAGSFPTFNGVTAHGIVQLTSSGSVDPSFSGAPSTNGDSVTCAALQTDGKLVIAGDFTLAGHSTKSAIARLNSNGSLDTSFNSDAQGDSVTIEALGLQSGKVVAVGNFGYLDGTANVGIIRFNADGSIDRSFTAFTGFDTDASALALRSDGKVVVAGDFSSVDNTVRNYVALLGSDGSVDPSFNPGVGVPSVASLALQATDGSVIVGGSFTEAGGQPANALARLRTDGSLDPTFTAPFNPGDTVPALALQTDGNVVASQIPLASTGSKTFLPARGDQPSQIVGPHSQTRISNPIVRCKAISGNVDASFSKNAGTDGTAYSFGLQTNGQIVVGGSFTGLNTVGGHTNLGRLNADGTLDASFNTTANNTVQAVLAQSDGHIALGGIFTQINTTTRNGLARLNSDGTLDTSFSSTAGTDGPVLALAQQSDGKLVAGGSFATAGGQSRSRLARFNSDGTLDTSFNAGVISLTGGTAQVTSIVQQSDSRLIIAGLFSQVGGYTRNNVARLNGDGSVDPTYDPASGPNAIVRSIALQPDGKTLLGGDFTSVDSTARNAAARLLGSKNVPAPVVTSASSAGAVSGQPFTYQTVATNNPGLFGASGLPAGLSINTATGLVSGTPTQTGVYQVGLSATNLTGTGKLALTLTVNPSPVSPPAITSALTANAQVAAAFSYQITANNTPTTYGASGLPNGLTVNSTSGLISGTPTAVGIYNISLSAGNTGGTGTATLVLTISAQPIPAPAITSVLAANGQTTVPLSYQITASNNPVSFNASSLPDGLTVNTTTGLISGVPKTPGVYSIVLTATNSSGTGAATLTLTVANPPAHPFFFTGEVALGQGAYYLAFPGNGNIFGYYEYLSDPHFVYHFDLGFEYWFDTGDGSGGIYFYDFTSNDFFYTGSKFSFPYLYDFNLQAFLYYYPSPTDPQRYNTNGVRYFFNFSTGQVITK